MKRILALILSASMVLSLLSGCSNQSNNTSSVISKPSKTETISRIDNRTNEESESVVEATIDIGNEANLNQDSSSAGTDILGSGEVDWESDIKFTGMSDETLLPYIEDTVYTQLVQNINSSEYFIENVSAVYISQEYLEELAYNSQANVFFGYSIAELDEYFEGTRYIFTLGEDGQTSVEALRVVEDATYDKMLKNVAVGTGVILICVTVSAVTAGLGTAPAISMIFGVAAKTGAACALSGTVIGGVTSAAVKGYQTGDMKEALKAGALSATEGYKWGAISGMLTGGAGEAWGLYSATGNGLTMNQVATIQQESRYPLDVIKQFHNMDEYQVFRDANLKATMVGKKSALIKTDIDLKRLDPKGRTNLDRMKEGLAPLDANGKSYELHHIGQKKDGTLAILSQSEHDAPAIHGFLKRTEVHGPETNWDAERQAFWKAFYSMAS